MTDYTELVKALRCCATMTCKGDECKYMILGCHDCFQKLHDDAAAAIEELDAEETRLLLITSELQDKVVELEEELNDVDIAADDNARQVEELQAEIRESMQKCAECGDRCVEVVRCRECKHCYAEGFVHEHNVCEKHPELNDIPDNWYCGDGERRANDGTD